MPWTVETLLSRRRESVLGNCPLVFWPALAGMTAQVFARVKRVHLSVRLLTTRKHFASIRLRVSPNIDTSVVFRADAFPYKQTPPGGDDRSLAAGKTRLQYSRAYWISAQRVALLKYWSFPVHWESSTNSCGHRHRRRGERVCTASYNTTVLISRAMILPIRGAA